jgi:hypothetical protein
MADVVLNRDNFAEEGTRIKAKGSPDFSDEFVFEADASSFNEEGSPIDGLRARGNSGGNANGNGVHAWGGSRGISSIGPGGNGVLAFGGKGDPSGSGVWGVGGEDGGIGVAGDGGKPGGIGIVGNGGRAQGTVEAGTGVLGVGGGVGPSFGVLGISGAQGGVGTIGVVSPQAGSVGKESGFGVLGADVDQKNLPALPGIAVGVYGVSSRPNAEFARGVSGVLGSEDLDAPENQQISDSALGVFGRAAFYNGELNGRPRVFTKGLAAGFAGTVAVLGDFYVVAQPPWSNGIKAAAVPFPDGTHRALYCVESPESWFEDFGRARLKKGCAKVEIEKGFASVADTTNYFVFLTPCGDSEGLFVAKQSKAVFEVREAAGGKGNIEFCYRIVAKRKDIEAKRLPKLPFVKSLLSQPAMFPMPGSQTRGTRARRSKLAKKSAE